MADVFSLGTYSDVASWSDGTSKDTGDLRRKYNFGDRVSELNIAQDPFFRFVSKVPKSQRMTLNSNSLNVVRHTIKGMRM